MKSGRYNNATEVVRAGLRLLEGSEQARELKLAELHRLVAQGQRSGKGHPTEDVLARLEAKYRTMAERA